MTKEHKHQLQKSIYLYEHAPILSENNALRPLCDATFNDIEWGMLIGFELDPNSSLPVEKNHFILAKKFIKHSFATLDGNELPKCKVLTRGNVHKNISSDTPLPIFSVIDFKTIPMRCCASLMLQNYVASHIGSEDSKNRDDLMSMATRTCELNKKN